MLYSQTNMSSLLHWADFFLLMFNHENLCLLLVTSGRWFTRLKNHWCCLPSKVESTTQANKTLKPQACKGSEHWVDFLLHVFINNICLLVITSRGGIPDSKSHIGMIMHPKWLVPHMPTELWNHKHHKFRTLIQKNVKPSCLTKKGGDPPPTITWQIRAVTLHQPSR